MTKQTKLIKFMLIVLMLIPLLLFSVAIVQTFVLKDAHNKLLNAKNKLEQSEQELTKQQQIKDYVFDIDENGNYVISKEYQEELYKHNQENLYGKQDDVNVVIK